MGTEVITKSKKFKRDFIGKIDAIISFLIKLRYKK